MESIHSNKTTNIIAAILLAIMLITAFFSMKNDSTTMDELAHIPAGYSYLTQKDFRLNPEHPPLVKDLAALPLLGLNLNFPENHPSWQNEINGQWWFGSQFLNHSGNNADQITFLARLPMLLLLIFLGWFLFFWTKQLAGNKTALFVLSLFSFSPTFLAHGRLVTTDVAAALGLLLATFFWLKFLKEPNKKNIFIAGIIFGVAMLLKYSLILLIPFFGVITIIYAALKTGSLKQIVKYAGMAILIAIIGVVFVIWPVYQLHTLNYPPERQLSDTKSILESNNFPVLKDFCVWAADKSGFRSLGHYFLGLLMATQRTVGGNTVYFMGIISAAGWWYYFPVVYVLKIPLAFHILTFIALFGIIYNLRRPVLPKIRGERVSSNFTQRFKYWISVHFTEFSMFIFLLIYWFTSISGNLNIGVRHILPTFPFIYILVAMGIKNSLEKLKQKQSDGTVYRIAIIGIILLLAWYAGSSLMTYPYYLSYFNELAGGTQNGYKYVVDSNYDWGQDLKRLKKWTDENNINKIYIEYFGGSDTEYYLKEKFRPWQGTKPASEFPKGNYLAVSATLLQGGRGNPAPGFDQSTNHYQWLNDYEPATRIGASIFVYYIDPVRE